jgi:intraflagellar transport protein 172
MEDGDQVSCRVNSIKKRILLQDVFEELLLIAHYFAARSAYSKTPDIAELATLVAVALLRHTDILPADKAFYEAGIACKVPLA